jgi:glycerophosphoryl diester phosphodiesterase
MPLPLGIQGHRGARGLFPENTLEGFVATAALGVTRFELDVGLTADGVAVVHHDPKLNPDIARDASGHWLTGPGPAIRLLTFAALSQYDVGRLRPGSATAGLFPDQQPIDGARVPRLASVLDALPDARFTVEIKTDPAHPDWTATPAELAGATLAAIDAAAAVGRVVVEAFDWRVQRHIRATRPDIKLAWLTRPKVALNAPLWWGREAPASIPDAIAAEGGGIWAPYYADLTQADIQAARALGVPVLPWTVNAPGDMQRLIDWGVDGLITDRPDLAP